MKKRAALLLVPYLALGVSTRARAQDGRTEDEPAAHDAPTRLDKEERALTVLYEGGKTEGGGTPQASPNEPFNRLLADLRGDDLPAKRAALMVRDRSLRDLL